MRLTFLKSSLPFILVGTLMFGQQSKASLVQQPAQGSAAKQASAPAAQAAGSPKAHHRTVRKRYKKVSHRAGTKRAAYRPEYTQVPVEVITGSTTQHVMFVKPQPGSEKASAPPGQMKVDIINGTTTDTQYFYDNGQNQAAAGNHPVVVSVESSDTRVIGGNKHPVVTAITTAGAGDTRSASSGGQKVTKGIAPQRKRQEYQPETH